VPAGTISLDELSYPDSLRLLRHEAGMKGRHEVSAASEDFLSLIYAVTGGNPQAFKLVVGQCYSQPLSRILGDLRAGQGWADEFHSAIYQGSWSRLSLDAQCLLLSIRSIA
jgi:hypothetical protein